MSQQTKTKEAETVHGTVEYEVVKCDSCETEIRKEDANEFTIGHTDGYACDVCKETGPINFPTPTIRENIQTIEGDDNDLFATGVLGVLIIPLCMIIGILNGFDDTTRDQFLRGISVTGWVVSLYLLGFGIIWWLL